MGAGLDGLTDTQNLQDPELGRPDQGAQAPPDPRGAEAAAVAEEIEAADRLLAGGAAHLQAMQKSGRVRLLLLDGPAVLGRWEMHRIEAEHGDASLLLGLREALAESGCRDAPLEALAALLSAVFERAALEVSEGARRADMEAAIRTILLGVVEGRARDH